MIYTVEIETKEDFKEINFADLKIAVGYAIIESLSDSITQVKVFDENKIIYTCDNGTLTAVDGIRWH